MYCLQKGVFRTNCIDCLDRTNVVQSLLASQNLATVLHKLGVLTSPSTLELEDEKAFQTVYRNAWADHANLISVQYAGTGALKTDYTRTGVRTKFGLAQASSILFYLNFIYTFFIRKNRHDCCLQIFQNCAFFLASSTSTEGNIDVHKENVLCLYIKWFRLAKSSDHWKTEQNDGHLVFGPSENRTSKRSVFQCSVFKPTLVKFFIGKIDTVWWT